MAQESPSADYPEFSPDALWNIMRRKNISPARIISELGISPRTFGVWVAGAAEPRPMALKQLARVLEVPQSALLELSR